MDDKKSKKEIIVKHKHNFNLFGVVFLILLTTKLLGVADISWIWVFSPFIILLGLIILFIGLAIVIEILKAFVK
ncbi:MAG: hypothetical protein A2Z35_06165 [Actinobacteria bacterium RBG_19FT_COMBO_36_27]|nr:MAG: hypothetical protein A2Z35_06165 [Actinobacteria bacterium RBG_19FT_COMBO_36_27]